MCWGYWKTLLRKIIIYALRMKVWLHIHYDGIRKSAVYELAHLNIFREISSKKKKKKKKKFRGKCLVEENFQTKRRQLENTPREGGDLFFYHKYIYIYRKETREKLWWLTGVKEFAIKLREMLKRERGTQQRGSMQKERVKDVSNIKGNKENMNNKLNTRMCH